MLLIGRYLARWRSWRRKRSIERRMRLHHTMRGTSLEKTKLGLELMLEREITLVGYVDIKRQSLYEINMVLDFYLNDLTTHLANGARPAPLPENLKEDYNVERAWLDMFFLHVYKDASLGVEVCIDRISKMLELMETLSPGMRDNYTRKCRPILKHLDVVVEHYL